MCRYLVTPELMNAWVKWQNKPEDNGDNFKFILSGGPALQEIFIGQFTTNDEVYKIIKGGTRYIPVKKDFKIGNISFTSMAIAHVVKGPNIYILKRISKWTPGMMIGDTEPVMLKYLSASVRNIIYLLVDDNQDVYVETYESVNIPDIESIVEDMVSWLRLSGLKEMYQSKWNNGVDIKKRHSDQNIDAMFSEVQKNNIQDLRRGYP